MAHNLKFNKKLKKKFEKDYGCVKYLHYDNYDAIEVPFVECIPSDYNDVMGVPVTFLDKYACNFKLKLYICIIVFNNCKNDMAMITKILNNDYVLNKIMQRIFFLLAEILLIV